MLPLFARHTFFSTTLFIVIYWVTACLAEYQTIDNLDDSIHYYGAWTSKYENDDPQHLNWEGTVVYGDIPGADCVVYFEGTRIVVYGAYFPPGQYDMQSSYAIDDGPATTFTPNPVVSESQYRQKFYESPQLSAGKHTLTITNLGRQFWFDFAQVEVDGPVSGENPVPVELSTTTAKSPPTTSTSTVTVTKDADAGVTTKSSTSTSTSTKTSSPSTSSAISSTTTSSGSPSAPTPSNGSSTSAVSFGSSTTDTQATSATRTESSGITGAAIPTTAGGAASSHPSPGIIAGIAVAGALIVLLMLLLVWWLRRKHISAAKERNVEPYDPNLTATPDSAAFLFDREKFAIATSREALIPPSPDQRAPPYPSGDTLQTPNSATQLLLPLPNIRTQDIGRETRSTTAKPTTAGGSSAVSPNSQQPGIFVSASSAPREPTRQSLDGGIRLAGGPPVHMIGLEEPSRDSVISTLPPSYRYYP